MRFISKTIFIVSVISSIAVTGTVVFGQDEFDFFEKRIRPVLIEHCYECHSSDKDAEGGLLLDSREGWMRGGDSGPAIQPGEPSESRLLKAIQYDDTELQMPPDGKLPSSVIDDFKTWIASGARDPRENSPVPLAKKNTALSVADSQQHWAYRPIGRTIPPDTNTAVASAIDAFIQSKLDEHRLPAAGSAERRELLRRLTFDLHGLPPSLSETLEFETDENPDAYERVVDRLLSSPRFAERFARRWLDLTRYAESLTLRGFTLPQAWRFRDYVVRSIAEDRPIDAMIREHIAGDLMKDGPPDEQAERAVAASFLTLGNTNLEDQDKAQLEMDVVDEMLDTLGRAFMAQTIGCARCHDHKFDPIPTKDYYALAGIFKSTKMLQHDNVSKWIEHPLPMSESNTIRFEKIAAEAKALQSRIAHLEKTLKPGKGDGSNVVAVDLLAGVVVDNLQAKKVGEWQDSMSVPFYVGDGYIHDKHDSKGAKTITFEPTNLPGGNYEVRFAYSPGDNRASNLQIRVFGADGESTIQVNQRSPAPIDGLWISLGKFRFETNGQAYVFVSNENTDGHVICDAIQFLPLDQGNVLNVVKSDTLNQTDTQKEVESLKKKKQELDAQYAMRPMVMALEEQSPVELPIHIRGSVHNLGDVVQRGFLQAVPVSNPPEVSKNSSGRLELARWITDSSNPLTLRVVANRLWFWVMDEGLVSTVDNFGTTGEPPSHPELLDWFSNELVSQGWSIKAAVRQLVLTDAYSRSSVQSISNCEQVDPQNRLYWRSNRKRLDAETLRDTILFLSGELDLNMYGRRWQTSLQADYGFDSTESCRSIYVPAFRNSTPTIFEVFDFVNLSVGSGRRNRSTVAPQSLFLLNNPWISERCRVGATNFLYGYSGHPGDSVEKLYLHILGRKPTADEQSAILNFVGDSNPIELSQEELAALFQSLISSLDFRFPL
jgi:Protein of unknown function (DUF1553)/Protein of unknown function (DUF1549)/Planctomycete cytochrome C